jgi:hypothetical protein
VSVQESRATTLERSPTLALRPSEVTLAKLVSEPWLPQDVTRVVAMTALGLIGVGVGWYGAGGTTSLNHQMLWTVLASAGAILIGSSQGLFVLQAFRVIRARRFAVMTDVAALIPGNEPTTVASPTDGDVLDVDELRVAADTMTHYHRPDCPLAVGKAVPLQGTPAEHTAQGRVACGVCGA